MILLPKDITTKREQNKLSFYDFIRSDNKGIGVYMIYCSGNDKIYVGSTSSSFKRRMSKHLHSLRKDKKDCTVLQKCFNKYGEESFDITVLKEACEKNDVIPMEDYFLELLLKAKSDFNYFKENGMNVCTVSHSSLGVKVSEEGRENMRKAQTGMKHTPERIRNNVQANLGGACSEETKIKIGLAHKGKKVSKETREKISKGNKGKSHENKWIPVYQFDLNKVLLKRFNFINEVKVFGFNVGNVYACCLGKRNFHKNSLWSFNESIPC